MGRHVRSPYENYILLSERCKYLAGTYPGFGSLTEIVGILTRMTSKHSNTYTYNGEMYVSKLTPNEISKIQNSLETGTYSSDIDKLRYICIDTGVRSF